MENIQQKDMIGSADEQTTKRAGDQKILTKVSEEMGHIPNPLQLMAMRPGTVATFMAQRNQILEGGPLSKKERELVALAIAVTLKSAPCIRTHAHNAQKAGAPEAEIIQTMLIASLMSGSAPLNIAYEAIRAE